MIKVTIYNEYKHELEDKSVAAVYPKGIHGCLADFLCESSDIEVKSFTVHNVAEITDEVLGNTDVLIWWGHGAHEAVPDEVAALVHKHVMCGMGFIALHSAHFSKPFIKLMGTTCSLCWREGDRERLWNIMPSHPIARGVGSCVEIPAEEMYGERFDVPTPDELIFMGWFRGGEVFRSGCVWNKGLGKVFYFQPGHESNPTYHIPEIQRIITNAVHYVAPGCRVEKIDCPHVHSLEATDE